MKVVCGCLLMVKLKWGIPIGVSVELIYLVSVLGEGRVSNVDVLC